MNARRASTSTLALQACVLACMLASHACNSTTVVGSTCKGEGCPAPQDCSSAEQQFPEICDKDASTCRGVAVESDEIVCDSCYDMIERLEIGSPVAPCACTYCALQLSACFDSAETEAEGGDPTRDQLCRAVVECGWAVGCRGSDCYCGEGVDRDTCLKNANEGRSQGACASVIQAAAKCADHEPAGTCVFGRQLSTNSLLDRATDVAKCVSGDPLLQGFVIEPKCR